MIEEKTLEQIEEERVKAACAQPGTKGLLARNARNVRRQKADMMVLGTELWAVIEALKTIGKRMDPSFDTHKEEEKFRALCTEWVKGYAAGQKDAVAAVPAYGPPPTVVEPGVYVKDGKLTIQSSQTGAVEPEDEAEDKVHDLAFSIEKGVLYIKDEDGGIYKAIKL